MYQFFEEFTKKELNNTSENSMTQKNIKNNALHDLEMDFVKTDTFIGSSHLKALAVSIALHKNAPTQLNLIQDKRAHSILEVLARHGEWEAFDAAFEKISSADVLNAQSNWAGMSPFHYLCCWPNQEKRMATYLMRGGNPNITTTQYFPIRFHLPKSTTALLEETTDITSIVDIKIRFATIVKYKIASFQSMKRLSHTLTKQDIIAIVPDSSIFITLLAKGKTESRPNSNGIIINFYQYQDAHDFLEALNTIGFYFEHELTALKDKANTALNGHTIILEDFEWEALKQYFPSVYPSDIQKIISSKSKKEERLWGIDNTAAYTEENTLNVEKIYAKSGVDEFMRLPQGSTPLMIAVYRNNPDTVLALLGKCDTLLKDKDNHTAIYYSLCYSRGDAQQMLLQYDVRAIHYFFSTEFDTEIKKNDALEKVALNERRKLKDNIFKFYDFLPENSKEPREIKDIFIAEINDKCKQLPPTLPLPKTLLKPNFHAVMSIKKKAIFNITPLVGKNEGIVPLHLYAYLKGVEPSIFSQMILDALQIKKIMELRDDKGRSLLWYAILGEQNEKIETLIMISKNKNIPLQISQADIYLAGCSNISSSLQVKLTQLFVEQHMEKSSQEVEKIPVIKSDKNEIETSIGIVFK